MPLALVTIGSGHDTDEQPWTIPPLMTEADAPRRDVRAQALAMAAEEVHHS